MTKIKVIFNKDFKNIIKIFQISVFPQLTVNNSILLYSLYLCVIWTSGTIHDILPPSCAKSFPYFT